MTQMALPKMSFHSLGHTSTGKLIMEQSSYLLSRMWAAHIKWSAEDHLEASKVIEEMIAKGKHLDEGGNELYNNIRLLADLHYDLYNKKIKLNPAPARMFGMVNHIKNERIKR